MKEHFNAYDVVGLITPGAFPVFAAMWVFPEFKELIGEGGATVGGLGIFVILALVVGQVLQSAGGILTKFYWLFWGGLPTSWILKPNQVLIPKEQREQIQRVLKGRFGTGFELSESILPSWPAVVKFMYSTVKRNGAADRVDTFNRQYGLCRALAAGTLAGIGFIAAAYGVWSIQSLISIIIFVLFMRRVHTFGKHYAQELLAQYLELSTAASVTESSPPSVGAEVPVT